MQVDAENGIDQSSLESRIDHFGSNIFEQRDPKSFCELVFEALDDLTMQILSVCAVISFIINYFFEDPKYFWIEPLAIILAVAACTLVAAVNDWQKEKQFRDLNAVAEDKKRVSLLAPLLII